MSITSGGLTVEVRTTGSDSNGGGFDTAKSGVGGVDFSQQNAPQAVLTTASVLGSGGASIVVAAGDYTVTSGDLGNLIQITGGTATAGFYEITAANPGTNTWTIDRSAGTAGATVVGNMGGALATPGLAASLMTTTGQKVYVKYTAGTPYAITTATTNVAGGCVSIPNGTWIIGYDTIRAPYTPFQNRPALQLGSGVSSAVMVTNVNAQNACQQVILDANSQTSSTCYLASGECFYVKAMNFTSRGISQNTASGRAILCEVTGGTSVASTGLSMNYAVWCVVHDNTMPTNIGAFNTLYAYGCIAYNNGADGFQAASGACLWVNCVAYNNGREGFNFGNVTGPATAINCISESNGAFGYFANTGVNAVLVNCAEFFSSSGRKNNVSTAWASDIGPIAGAASFFANAAGGDFKLSAAGLALCKGAGFPSQFTLGLTADFADIGAVQHLDRITPSLTIGI